MGSVYRFDRSCQSEEDIKIGARFYAVPRNSAPSLHRGSAMPESISGCSLSPAYPAGVDQTQTFSLQTLNGRFRREQPFGSYLAARRRARCRKSSCCLPSALACPRRHGRQSCNRLIVAEGPVPWGFWIKSEDGKRRGSPRGSWFSWGWPVLPRDNQDERACCLTRECSRTE